MIRDFIIEKVFVFKNLWVINFIMDVFLVRGFILINLKVERVVIFESIFEMIFVKNFMVFGFNIFRMEFLSYILIRDLEVRYFMINLMCYMFKGEVGEEKVYGEIERIVGNIEILNFIGVRRIGINICYLFFREIFKEYGINVLESKEWSVRVWNLIIRDVFFDVFFCYKRRVRFIVVGFYGRLYFENFEVFGYIEIWKSYLVFLEFVYVKVESNLVLRGILIYIDFIWGMIVFFNFLIEFEVGGFIIVEDCRFNNFCVEEFFYCFVRMSWEKSGDFDRVDEYYYFEMLVKRKVKF